MSCPRAIQGDLADRYLRGELAETENQAFEIHVLECGDCFELVDAGRLTQEALAGLDSQRKRLTGRGRWTVANLPIAAGLAAVTVGSVLLLRSSGGGPPPRILVGPKPSAPTASPAPALSARRGAELAELARFDPPLYVPLTLRGAGPRKPTGFDPAMAHYARREFPEAVAGLREVVREQPESSEAWFFLGISELLASAPAEAVVSLGRAVAAGPSPHSRAARFFLAKALLVRGDVEGAKRELKAAAADGQPFASEAREMIARLERLGAGS